MIFELSFDGGMIMFSIAKMGMKSFKHEPTGGVYLGSFAEEI